MKTLLSTSLSLLAFALISFAQSPPPGQAPATAPAGAPGTSPAAQAPTNPAAAAQSPATNVPAGQPAAPGASVPVTLSPAPAGQSPAAATTGASPVVSASPEQPPGFLGGSRFIDKIHKGERIFWWTGRWFRRDPKRIEKVFTAIENGDEAEASRLSRGSRDPVLRMMWNGLNHRHASLEGALQVAAGIEIKRAGRFLVVMDTLVTLAPLLGLLGTITGLIRSLVFSAM